ncbi:MAG: KpsF/GutQ family sugar-phosphate isomerase [Planctomycetes bacterium]|nr:KpsF/GutQ family sugar-phosphate isomerase [Planctomycetota bacterium]
MTDIREFGKSVLQRESEGITRLAGLLDENFDRAVDAMLKCTGHVVVSGVGKPWLIGQKISATLASTGTPSFALHPSEAMHGDLGRLRKHDVVIALSNSGTSEEITRLLPVVKRIGCLCIGLTSNVDSPLASNSDIVINMGKVSEACPIGMAPSVSTTVMLALGDALALVVMKAREFTKEDYARFHPGGALGRSLMKVGDIMRPIEETAVVGVTAMVVDALHAITLHKTGAAFIVDKGVVKGVFTDGDLRRHVDDENLLSQPIVDVMTSPCLTIHEDKLAPEAVRMMQRDKRLVIGELPVVDAARKLRGHVALKDLVVMHFM